MPRFRVDPRVVKVVQMKDGTRYRPSREGWVGVGARHEDEMAGSGARYDRQESVLDGVTLAVPTSRSAKACDGCGFVAWTWAKECGRCGRAI